MPCHSWLTVYIIKSCSAVQQSGKMRRHTRHTVQKQTIYYELLHKSFPIIIIIMVFTKHNVIIDWEKSANMLRFVTILLSTNEWFALTRRSINLSNHTPPTISIYHPGGVLPGVFFWLLACGKWSLLPSLLDKLRLLNIHLIEIFLILPLLFDCSIYRARIYYK